MTGQPLSLEIDPDRFLDAAYGPTLELLESGAPYQSEELVPGRPETAVRIFSMPLPVVEMVALESVCQALEAHPSGPERSAALKAAVRAWQPVHPALDLDPSISVGLDGQGVRLDEQGLPWR